MNPNPGSDLALSMGCTCPDEENNFGKFPPWLPDGWFVVHGCPVHAEEFLVGEGP